MTDAIGIDMHFIRFFHLALFDSRPIPLSLDFYIGHLENYETYCTLFAANIISKKSGIGTSHKLLF